MGLVARCNLSLASLADAPLRIWGDAAPTGRASSSAAAAPEAPLGVRLAAAVQPASATPGEVSTLLGWALEAGRVSDVALAAVDVAATGEPCGVETQV